MQYLIKWALFISSCVPVFIMVFLNNLKGFDAENLIRTYNINPLFWWALLLLTIVSLIVVFVWLWTLKNYSKGHGIQVTENAPVDSEILNFFVTFIIPIMALDPSSFPSIVMNILLWVVEGIYFTSNNALHFNILLLIMGYHVYLFNGRNILITKCSMETIEREGLSVRPLGTSGIYYREK